MDNAHFDELMRELSLTRDTRLLELAKRNQNKFLLLLLKMIETAVESGITEENLHSDVANAAQRVPRLGHARMSQTLTDYFKGKSFNITWGPDNGRPAGYYVSIPNYSGGAVVPLETLETLLQWNLVVPRKA